MCEARQAEAALYAALATVATSVTTPESVPPDPPAANGHTVDADNFVATAAAVLAHPPPARRCYACHGARYWQRPDGSEWVCATCHPPPVPRPTVEVGP
jgi:hypothetical protein